MKSTGKIDSFFRFSIGNNALVENVLNVKAVPIDDLDVICGDQFVFADWQKLAAK